MSLVLYYDLGQPAEGFCELSHSLEVGIDEGIPVLQAVRDFMDMDPASQVASLPVEAQDAAQALLSVAQTVMEVGRSAVYFVLPVPVLDAIKRAVAVMSEVCAAVGAGGS